ncbi:MAG: hypothetical protein L0H55_12125, partial [Candidatus Nitrosocosmicus sp.]|nr:hypothetical protein [Candidatus Nitrosocosmicus sp.]
MCSLYAQINLNNIHSFINSFDNIKILEKLQLAFITNENLEYHRLIDSGGIFFLTGLMLKKEKNNLPDPPINALNNLVKTLMFYIDHYYQKIFEEIRIENTDEATQEFKFKLFSFKLLNQVNYGGYQFQYDDLGKAVFGKLDSFFEQKIGFTFSDTMKFIQYVESEFESSFERNRQKMRSAYNIYKINKKLNEKGLYDFPLFDIKIDTQAIQTTNSLDEESLNRFMKFLNFLSIQFGDQHSTFNNLLDNNILFEKPIIKRTDGYFCPSLPLLWDHHVYFANMMKNELSNNTRTGKKYTKIKSNYLEEKTGEFLERIFPPGSVFSNLYYFDKNTEQSFETDVLIKYGNVIVILEAKTGELSDAALRGAPKSLTKDLAKMLGKSYSQGKRVQDFITAEEPARFYNNDKTKLLLEIDKKKPLKFLICSITLYPLRALSTKIEDLDSLGLFPIDEYPISLSLFDIDILTQ